MRYPTNFVTRSFVALCAFCALIVCCCFAFAEQSDGAKSFLLSDEFFSDLYGTDVEDLTPFLLDRKIVELPFASDREAGRGCLDAPLKLDCSVFSAYEFVCDVDNPQAIGSVTLYFHSKSGWYHFSSSSKRSVGSNISYVFNANNYTTEGEPVGLDQVDAVRLAFWRGGDVDARITVRSFRASKTSYAIINVDDQGGENGSFVRSFSETLSRFGLSAESVDGASATGESLKRYSVVFLPIAGKISPNAVDALCEYVDQGGFLFACYNAPAKLLEKWGFDLPVLLIARRKVSLLKK